MWQKIHISGMALGIAMLIILASGCASSSQQLEQPQKTSYMNSVVGTSNEMSPIAPAGAKNMRKDGNQWMCEINGQTMIYNAASAQWEPKH
jgi:hypothetical protein